MSAVLALRPATNGDRVALAETIAQLGRVTPCHDGETLVEAVRRLVAERDAALERAAAAEARLVPAPTVATYLGLTVDVATGRASAGGIDVPLTRTEARLVFALVRAAGEIVSRDALLAEVWGPGSEGAYQLLRVNVWRIRQELAEVGLTVRTRLEVGYALVAADRPRPRWDVSRHERGVPRGLARLTADQIAEIRRLRRRVPQRALADRYGIALNTVGRIQRGLLP